MTTARRMQSLAFHSAYEVLTNTVKERRARRLTPPAPPPPRDSDPQAGEALPEHAISDERDALPPPPSRWAVEDSDDGDTRR